MRACGPKKTGSSGVTMRILCLIVCCIGLASCSTKGTVGSLPLSPVAPNLDPQTHPAYKVLYAFTGHGDGGGPVGPVVAFGGKLYGTTLNGGVIAGCNGPGCGTIFEMSASGKERAFYAFTGGRDGGLPDCGLTALGGKLYSTTPLLDADNLGTVFEVSTAGVIRVLHNFKGSPDGRNPMSGLLAVHGTLFGVTFAGGTTMGCYGSGCGTVYDESTAGKERVLYRFKGAPDGAEPWTSLLALNGSLYGATSIGGASNAGTVFEVSPSGKERVIYSFKGQPDGATPFAGLITLDGKLYGTTTKGGTDNLGTVFEVTASGKERVIYSFRGSPDGSDPHASLITLSGKLYGTTYQGGASQVGTVFEVTKSGAEKVLHSFKGSPDGSHPYANLIALHGKLYGTTSGGGTGAGTVFELRP